VSFILRIIFIVLMIGISGANPALSRPLEMSADGQNLIDEEGHSVAFNGCASWYLFARLNREETRDYLDKLSSDGFDALLVQLIVSEGRTGSSRNAYGEEPFRMKKDFTTPNEAYFDHIDWVVSEALSRGFTLLITPTYLGYECGNQGWCREMIAAGPSTMENWGKWVGRRYKDFGRIIWVHAGDADANSWDALEVVNAVANGIRATDPEHLHTAHCQRNSSAVDCYDQPWLDINTTYSDCLATPQRLFDDFISESKPPTIYIEGQYEYHSQGSAQCIRGQAYAAGLGGAVGHVFGSEKIWDFPDGWQDELGSPGYEAMVIFGKLMAARKWPHLTPDYEHLVVVSGYGSIDSNDYVSAARGVDRKTVLAYFPSLRPVQVSLAAIDGQVVEATWFDPSTGEAIPAGVFPAHGVREFTPPSSRDWVLILDDEATVWQDAWFEKSGTGSETHRQIRLFPPAPNPFNDQTRVAFSAPVGTSVKILIFDALGRKIEILFDGLATGILQEAIWGGGNRSAGKYFVRLSVGQNSETQRIVLEK
jgi:Protein of unknown function (DUF4038)/Putative collagen-binding domain of a collagenase